MIALLLVASLPMTAFAEEYNLANDSIGGSGLGNGSDITISGGTVTATGGQGGAGIGGGNKGEGENFKVYDNAQLKVQGGESSVSIGTSCSKNGSLIPGIEVKPDVSELTAEGENRVLRPRRGHEQG